MRIFQRPKLCEFLVFISDFWTIFIASIHTKQATKVKWFLIVMLKDFSSEKPLLIFAQKFCCRIRWLLTLYKPLIISCPVVWMFFKWLLKNVIVVSFLCIFIVWQFHKSNKTSVCMPFYFDKDYSTSFRSLDGWKNPRLLLGFSVRHLEAECCAIIFIRVQRHETEVLSLKYYLEWER